jgi:hypothetical protein
MDNLQKAYKAKAKMSLRAQQPVAHMADGGAVQAPAAPPLSMAARALATVMPTTVRDLSTRGQMVDKAVDNQAPAAPAPTAYKSKMETANGLRFAGGGEVDGPGTGTSDSIPARLSDGEYVLSADTVKHIGVDKLDAIQDALHKPVGLRGDGDGDGRYADGGPVYPRNALSPNPGTGARPNFTFGDNSAASPPPAGNTSLALRSPLNEIPFPKEYGATDVPFTETPKPAPAAPSAYERGQAFRQAISPAVKTLASGLPSKLDMAGNTLGAVSAMAPIYHAVTDENNGMSAGQKLKAVGSSALNAVGGIAGGAAGGVALGIGTSGLGAIPGGIAGSVAGYNAADAAQSGVRKGLNYVNEKLGGSPNYITSVAEDMQKAGYNPDPTFAQKLQGNPRAQQAPASTPATATPDMPATSTAPATPVLGERDQFISDTNARMGLSAPQQAGALTINPSSLRGGVDASGPNAANLNLRDTTRGLQGGQAFNVGMPGGSNIYATRDGNGPLTLTGTGTTPDDHGALQRELTSQRVADLNHTGDLQRQVNGLRSAEADRNSGATQFGSGAPKLVSAVTLNARNAAEANAVNERNSLRSYDASVYGHQITGANAAAQRKFEGYKLGIEQNNKDREYDASQSRDQLAARTTGQKSLAERLAASTPNGPDGKPDTQAIAQKQAAVTAYVSQRAQQLQAHLSLHPGDKAAASELANIQDNGHSALGDEQVHKITSGLDAANLAQQYHSNALNPFGGRAVQSDAPIKTLTPNNDGIFGFGATATSDRGDKIPMRGLRSDGSFFGGQTNQKYEDLFAAGAKEAAARAKQGK